MSDWRESLEGPAPPAVFELGEIVITVTAADVLTPQIAAKALARHVSGDWGDVCADDRAANERALKDGERLFSVYHTDDGTAFWIITEWDRSTTTILLPEDY